MKRTAFTLIELLVVVAIIVALLAILMPSLNKAIEQANRAMCASQLHQTGVSLLGYAADQYRKLPPANATLGYSNGIDSTYVVPPKVPFGLAYLIVRGYVPDAKVLYCPSWRHPHMQIGKVNTATDAFGFAPGTMGGWPEPGQSGPTSHRGISYHYRATFGPSANQPATLTSERGAATALIADHWTRREGLLGVIYGHVNGYNTEYMDGHVAWVSLSANQMELLQPVGFGITNGNWAFQELIWRDWFDGR